MFSKIRINKNSAVNFLFALAFAGSMSVTGYLIIKSSAGTDSINLSFSQSGLHGAGFQNVISINPNSTNELLVGADVAGIHKSTNQGDKWVPVNQGEGFSNQGYLKIASITHSKNTSGKVYAAIGGTTNTTGGWGDLFVSTDSGNTWRPTSITNPTPSFSGAKKINPDWIAKTDLRFGGLFCRF